MEPEPIKVVRTVQHSPLGTPCSLTGAQNFATGRPGSLNTIRSPNQRMSLLHNHSTSWHPSGSNNPGKKHIAIAVSLWKQVIFCDVTPIAH